MESPLSGVSLVFSEIDDTHLYLPYLEHPMAQKLDDQELVHPQEFMMANAIQLDALTQLLIEKSIITEEEFFTKLKEVQAEYVKRKAER